jgi:hypothetical protein
LNYIPDYVDEAYWNTSGELEIVGSSSINRCVVQPVNGYALPSTVTATVSVDLYQNGEYLHTISRNLPGNVPSIGTIKAKRYLTDQTVTQFINGQQYYFSMTPSRSLTVSTVTLSPRSQSQQESVIQDMQYLWNILSPAEQIIYFTGLTTGTITATTGCCYGPVYSVSVRIYDGCIRTEESVQTHFTVYTISAAPVFSINIYPNPVSSTLYIETEEENPPAGVRRVKLVAASTGAVALNQIVSNFNGTLQFNISNVPDGLYSVILMRDNTLLHSETIDFFGK